MASARPCLEACCAALVGTTRASAARGWPSLRLGLPASVDGACQNGNVTSHAAWPPVPLFPRPSITLWRICVTGSNACIAGNHRPLDGIRLDQALKRAAIDVQLQYVWPRVVAGNVAGELVL